MKQKFKSFKPLSMKPVITTVAIFIFTISFHYLSINLVDNNFVDAIRTIKLTQELPSVLAQTSTIEKTINSIKNETEDKEKAQEICPSDNPCFLGIRDLSSQMFVIILLLAVAFLLILTLLLCVIFPYTSPKSTLKDKADFLLATFPKLLEGITVIFVLIVVGTLGIGRQPLQPEVIAILSGIVGYVLGQKSNERTSTKKDKVITSENNIDDISDISSKNKF